MICFVINFGNFYLFLFVFNDICFLNCVLPEVVLFPIEVSGTVHNHSWKIHSYDFSTTASLKEAMEEASRYADEVWHEKHGVDYVQHKDTTDGTQFLVPFDVPTSEVEIELDASEITVAPVGFENEFAKGLPQVVKMYARDYDLTKQRFRRASPDPDVQEAFE